MSEISSGEAEGADQKTRSENVTHKRKDLQPDSKKQRDLSERGLQWLFVSLSGRWEDGRIKFELNPRDKRDTRARIPQGYKGAMTLCFIR